jgi:putative transposase
MLRSYKTEIKPTDTQALKIRQTIGVCRFVYNLYLEHNQARYAAGERHLSAYDFSWWLNHVYLVDNPDKLWIKQVSSKAVKQAMINAEGAYKNFFAKRSRYPKFKRKHAQNVKMYFVKTDARTIIRCERHRIQIPTLGFVRLKEKGYIPVKATIKSGAVSYKAGRYYVSVLVDEPVNLHTHNYTAGIGIDLGLKTFAVASNGKNYSNINKTKQVRKVEKKLKREQRKLSRKYESYKKRKNNIEGEATRQNISKQVQRVQKLHQRLTNLRTDHVNNVVSDLVRTKPNYITIEDLNVSGMMKNRHLSKAIAQQKFFEFRSKLLWKCKQLGIELRVVNRFYPSSKLCHACGCINQNLKLSDRVFHCDCGYIEDRDLNAALNLRDAETYTVAS